MTYDNVGNILSQSRTTDAGLNTTSYIYDELNRQTVVTDANGSTNRIYDGVGNVISTTDAELRTTKSTYDNLNRLRSVTAAFGTSDATTTAYKYDLVGNLVKQTNGRGYATNFGYDELNRQVAMTDVYGNDTLTEYFDTDTLVSGVIGELGLGFFAAPTSLLTGQVIKTTDALGKATYVLYDKFGRQSATYDATKHRTSASQYDAVDRVIAETDTFGQITHYSYNDALNKTTSVDPYGGSSYERTDAVGNLIEDVDSLGRSTRYSYDKRDRQIQTIDPKGGFTRYEYTADNLTKKVRDAVLNETTYIYDVTGRLVKEHTSFGDRLYQYDNVGNRTSATDRNLNTTTYTYDNLDRLKSETWVGNGQQFIYTYDKNGNRLTASDGNIKYVYSYDHTDLIESVDRQQAGNPTVSFKYEYDDVGNLTKAEESIANSIQATTIYEYNDPRYLNTKISQTGTGLVTKDVKFAYDAAGLNTQVERYVDGLLKVDTTNAFDVYGRLTGIEHHRGGVTLGSSSYIIDDLDRLKTETKDGLSRTIGYDSIDQVATVTGSNSEAYTYDLNGNRINTGYVTGADNRLMSDGVYNYQYDAEGNRTQRKETATGIVDRYTWDYRNRLVSIVTVASGGAVLQTVEYEYDVDDQRVRKTVTSALPTGGVVENYFIDRDQIAFVTDGSGIETFHYLYGLDVDSVMAQDSPAGMVWSLADRLGSIDTLTDKDGNVVDKRSFDSFGRVLSETNPSVSFRYGYTGRERDLESGLSYYRARYYDSNVGRFISVDPIGFAAGDTNLYRYVGNSSTLATDPTGKFAWFVWGGIALAGALIGLATDSVVQSARKADNPNYEYNKAEAAVSAITGAVLTPLAVAAAATGPIGATFVGAFGLTSSILTLNDAQKLSDKKNPTEKKVLQALGVFGIVSSVAGLPGGGKLPPLGGASAVVANPARAGGAISTAVNGSRAGGAVGQKADDLFQHYMSAILDKDGNRLEPGTPEHIDAAWERKQAENASKGKPSPDYNQWLKEYNKAKENRDNGQFYDDTVDSFISKNLDYDTIIRQEEFTAPNGTNVKPDYSFYKNGKVVTYGDAKSGKTLKGKRELGQAEAMISAAKETRSKAVIFYTPYEKPNLSLSKAAQQDQFKIPKRISEYANQEGVTIKVIKVDPAKTKK